MAAPKGESSLLLGLLADSPESEGEAESPRLAAARRFLAAAKGDDPEELLGAYDALDSASEDTESEDE